MGRALSAACLFCSVAMATDGGLAGERRGRALYEAALGLETSWGSFRDRGVGELAARLRRLLLWGPQSSPHSPAGQVLDANPSELSMANWPTLAHPSLSLLLNQRAGKEAIAPTWTPSSLGQ